MQTEKEKYVEIPVASFYVPEAKLPLIYDVLSILTAAIRGDAPVNTGHLRDSIVGHAEVDDGPI